MTRPPLIQRPIYLSGAQPPPAPAVVREVCERAKPAAGLLGATLLGATAAYFVPKFLDSALAAWRARRDGYAYDDGDGTETVELDTE